MKEIVGFILMGICLVVIISSVTDSNALSGVLGGVGFFAGLDMVISEKTKNLADTR